MGMEKKPFFKGLVLGVAAAVMCGGFYQSASAVWQRMGNSEIELDNKVQMIENTLGEYYLGDLDQQKMKDGIYYGLVASLGDPYTTYLSAENFDDFMADTEGEAFSGVGIEITIDPEDNAMTVITPILNSPAAKAGIQPGDKIVKVDGFVVTVDSMEESISKMKGTKGTNVVLSIFRPSENRNFDVTITRDDIVETTVSSKMLPQQIGYLRITQFKEHTYTEFKDAYDSLTKQGQKGMIIDVRNNPGGLFEVVGQIVDELVPEGTYVYTIDKNGERVDSQSDANHIEIPLCILVNGGSASASEILSGAVQDMKVGTLVGTQTFGKGLVQALYPLPDGSALKITIQKYYTPNGICIQGEGIRPDHIIELPDTVKNILLIEEKDDTQLQKAISVIDAQLK